MTALIWIDNRFHARLLTSRLKQSHGNIIVCTSAIEAKVQSAQSDMLFVCTQAVPLIKDIRRGASPASPFMGISLLNLDGGQYDDLGVNDEFCAPYSLADLDAQYQSLKYPKQDFIAIPEVYTGPERRRKSQTRPIERRIAPHRYEKRYRPINGNTGTTWQQIPNQAFLDALLPLHHAFQQGHKASAIPKLHALLQQYQYPHNMIKNILGDYNA